MINRHFYQFDEVVSRLGTDSETLRQAVATGKIPVFLSLHGEQAELTRGEITPDELDPYCEFHLYSREPLYEDGEPVEMYTLSGWFRVGQRHSREAARQYKFGQRLALAPSTTDVEFTPWGISFLLDTRERHFSENAWILAQGEPNEICPERAPERNRTDAAPQEQVGAEGVPDERRTEG